MPRFQDILFVVWGAALVALIAFHLEIVVFALLGAFVCGAIYLFIGMIPSRNEGFWNRAFVSGFLSIVLSSLVLIVPATFGLHRPAVLDAAVAMAVLLPCAAVGFEIVRTPRVMRTILRSLRHR